MDSITGTNSTKQYQRRSENTCQLIVTVTEWLCDLGFIGCGFLVAPSWSPSPVAQGGEGSDPYRQREGDSPTQTPSELFISFSHSSQFSVFPVI